WVTYTVSMMENGNDSTLLLLVLFLSQNKRLMEDMGPVLTFLEEHEQTLSSLQKILSFSELSAPTPPQEKQKESTHVREEERKNEETEEKKSPLQGIANEEILKGIRSYFAAQADKNNQLK
ncbi:MAG: hypothetical protein J6Z36_03975, partial [Clostridia bacterium]|nr:hypothetical protein [Clostridia bacterium]